jgi:hypothetical protein
MSFARVRLTTAALVSAGLDLAGFGPAAGTAQAQPAPTVCQDPNFPPGPANYCTYHWRPGLAGDAEHAQLGHERLPPLVLR